ncbi:MAG TPA: MBL fold metallo-hydrolase [Herbaspirillum sp.]|jgi:L-ascorbate metabolism protein UlaG (beta-lactamase superfamily)
MRAARQAAWRNDPGKARRFAAALWFLLCLPWLLAGCGATNKYYDPDQPHRGRDGFRNNYLPADAPRPSLLKWQFERLLKGLPKPPENGYRFPIDQPDLAWLAANKTVPSATWIGHSTMLLQSNGVNLITDPIFSDRASPVGFMGPTRKVPPALSIAQLPHIDVVLISHNHYDHLDVDSVRRLNAQPGGPPLFLVPLGVKDWMHNKGIDNAREMDWWERASVQGLEIDFVPSQHWSARGLFDRNETLWGGWVVRSAAAVAGSAAPVGKRDRPFSFYFAGDSGYSRDFADIGRKYGSFDLAMIPIGAYAPRWFMSNQHVDPAQAVQIHRDVHAKQSVAIHWGTFELSDEPLDEPPKLLKSEMEKAGLPPQQFIALRQGQTLKW